MVWSARRKARIVTRLLASSTLVIVILGFFLALAIIIHSRP